MPSKMMIAAAGGAVVVGAGLWFDKQQQEKERLAKAQQAFCFIKPHAVTPKVIALSKDMLTRAGITITGEGELTAETIDSKRLIDTHYGAIAQKATVLKPNELEPSAKALGACPKALGVAWGDGPATGEEHSALDALPALSGERAHIYRRMFMVPDVFGRCASQRSMLTVVGHTSSSSDSRHRVSRR